MLKNTIYSKLYTEKCGLKNNKTVLNLIFNTVFVLFRFNRKSLKLQTSFIPPVATYVELSRHQTRLLIRQLRTSGARYRENIVENPLPIRSTSTVVHGKCH